MSDYSLTDLIDNCTNKKSPLFEVCWREFFRRYKKRIFQIILFHCNKWEKIHSPGQIKDSANDILSEVFIILSNSLNKFKNTGDERIFFLWLGTICSRTVNHYYKKKSAVSYLSEEQIEIKDDREIDTKWELFEYIVQTISIKNSNKKNAQRDLLLFLMYTWGSFSPADIRNFPCFTEIGHRVIDNVVSRARADLETL